MIETNDNQNDNEQLFQTMQFNAIDVLYLCVFLNV